MFDDVQAGWLAGDDYRVAAATAPEPLPECPEYQRRLAEADALMAAVDHDLGIRAVLGDRVDGRFEDPHPPGTPA